MKNYNSHQERLMMEALDIIGGSRREAYGPPERNFERIADLWNGYLLAAGDGTQGEPLNTRDICHMLDLVKLARLIETPGHEDSMRDRFGYQGCYVDLVSGEWEDWPADDAPSDPMTNEGGAGWIDQAESNVVDLRDPEAEGALKRFWSAHGPESYTDRGVVVGYTPEELARKSNGR